MYDELSRVESIYGSVAEYNRQMEEEWEQKDNFFYEPEEPLIKSQSDLDILNEIVNFIKENNITSYCDLVDYSLEEERSWFNTLSHTYIDLINQYIESFRNKINDINNFEEQLPFVNRQ